MTSTPTTTRSRFDLTPRQVEVMELIAAGKTNPEIAEHLGVSLDGAKYHVSEILSKLGVNSREEAVAAWQSGRSGTRWRWLGGGLGAAKVAGLAAGLIAVAAISAAVIVWAVGRGGDEQPVTPPPTAESSVSPAPSASASVTASPTPETLLGVTLKPLVLAEPIALPDNVALYLESGCWGCDSPAASLERVYRDPSSQLRFEDAFRLDGATVSAPEVAGKYITSVALKDGGDDILVAVCEGPYCGGVANVADGATVTVRHSIDGGVTWTTGAPVPGGAWLVSNMGGERQSQDGTGLIYRIAGPALGNVDEYAYYPSLATEPIELRGQDPSDATLLASTNGPVWLVGEDGLTLYVINAAATTVPTLDLTGLPAGSRIIDFQPKSAPSMVTWIAEGGALYSGFVDSSSNTLTEIYRWPDGFAPFFRGPVGGFIDSRKFVISVPDGRTGRGNVPALVDFDSGQVRQFEEFVDRAAEGDRLLVRGVKLGPFARVNNAGEGDCLNVRETPSLSATAFACYPDGVLLQELGERTDADGESWLYVATPQQNRPGWASASFLEVSGDAPTLAGHPAGTRTGVPEIDEVIAAFEVSAFIPDELISWLQVTCVTPRPTGLGGPPTCPEGVPDGTPIDAITGASCEGYWRLRPADRSPIELAVKPGDPLYGVVRLPADRTYPPDASFMMIYLDHDQPEFAKAVYLAEGGGIVGDWSGCAALPSELLKRGTVVFGPPS